MGEEAKAASPRRRSPPTCEEVCPQVQVVEAEQRMFRWWQDKQNGELAGIRGELAALTKRLDDKLDAVYTRMNDRFAALEAKLDARAAAVDARAEAATAKAEARAEAAKAPATELGQWLRNALWALLLFLAGLVARHLIPGA